MRLARDSDRALAPLAREREHVAGFIVRANATGEATAERSDDIRRGIDQLPAFLRELKPLMADLQGFADDATPVVSDLGRSAPALARLIKGQGELADAGARELSQPRRLARARRPGADRRAAADPQPRPARQAGRPGLEGPRRADREPDQTGGIERLMDFLYYSTLATNGFDSIGHYLRAGLVTNTCSNYTLTISPGCNATFNGYVLVGRGHRRARTRPSRAARAPAAWRRPRRCCSS